MLALCLGACGAVSTELPGLRCSSLRAENRRGADFERPPLPSCPLHPLGNQDEGSVDVVWADRSFAFVHIFDCQGGQGCGTRAFRLDGPGAVPVEVARPPAHADAFRPLPGGGALVASGRDIVRLRATEQGEWTSERIAPMPGGAYAAAVDVAGASILAAGQGPPGRERAAAVFRLGSDGQWAATVGHDRARNAIWTTMAVRPSDGDAAVVGWLERDDVVSETTFQHFSPDGRPGALMRAPEQRDGRGGPTGLYGDGDRLYLLASLDACQPTRHAIEPNGQVGHGEPLPAFGADKTFYRQGLSLGDGAVLLGGRSGRPPVARVTGVDRAGEVRFTHAYADWGCAEVAAFVRATPDHILVVVQAHPACDGGDLSYPGRASYAWIRPDGACAE